MPASLADHIRSKPDAGRIPSALPAKMWTRYRQGNACDGCDQPIHAAQIAYQFLQDSGDVLQLHIGCLGMWLAELRRRGLTMPTRLPPGGARGEGQGGGADA
jgi:hypothetical protein